jgi:hypothetical protein
MVDLALTSLVGPFSGDPPSGAATTTTQGPVLEQLPCLDGERHPNLAVFVVRRDSTYWL